MREESVPHPWNPCYRWFYSRRIRITILECRHSPPSGLGCLGAILFLAAILPSFPAYAIEPTARVSEAKKDNDGFLVHTVESPYEAGQTEVRVLLPERLEASRRYPLVYVLPVEARNENRYGDGLLEVKRHDLHNKHRAIFAAPTFSHLPWYADHPTDPTIRQETYLLQVVLPFVEKSYPALARPEGRLLLGFSKSGWGAFSLLLRHPGVFGKAAAWDAPLMMERPDRYGMAGIFGTQENFEPYQVSKLLAQRAADLQGSKRLLLTGVGNFRQHHQEAHELMTRLGIPHGYLDGPARKHDWHSGWVNESVGPLFQP